MDVGDRWDQAVRLRGLLHDGAAAKIAAGSGDGPARSIRDGGLGRAGCARRPCPSDGGTCGADHDMLARSVRCGAQPLIGRKHDLLDC